METPNPQNALILQNMGRGGGCTNSGIFLEVLVIKGSDYLGSMLERS